MSERKVLNKYFPPDFDPSKIVRLKRPGGPKQQVVRLMAPFSMRCNTCGEYIYKGKKFNARKETAKNETYFGIKIFRFYIKCTQCSAEITFKTDPKNTDYVAEHGAMRNFEPWRSDGTENFADETEEERLERLEREEAEDPMAALESKQVDSKREMDILDKLQEIRMRNARLERADIDTAFENIEGRADVEGVDIPVGVSEEEERKKREAEEDEAEVRRVFSKIRSPSVASTSTSGAQDDDRLVGVPNIELDEALEDEEAPSSLPVASSSKVVAEEPSATIKRKLADVEPDALSLLSSDARHYASTVSFAPSNPSKLSAAPMTSLPPPAKKKKDNPAINKLGIKLAPKKKGLV